MTMPGFTLEPIESESPRISTRTLQEALELIETNDYHKGHGAIDLLLELKAAGIDVPGTNIEEVLKQAKDKVEIQQSYYVIARLAESGANLEYARSSWAIFQASYPDFKADPENLAEKLNVQPVEVKPPVPVSPFRTFEGHTDGVTGVAYSLDGKYILTGSEDLTARVWDVTNGQTIRTFRNHRYRVLSVAYSPDGKYVLTGNNDGVARLWGVNSGQMIRVFFSGGDIPSVAFSPDGKYILTAVYPNAPVWDVSTEESIVEFGARKDGAFTSVAFSPDGKYVLMGSEDGLARIWDVSSGHTVRTFNDEW